MYGNAADIFMLIIFILPLCWMLINYNCFLLIFKLSTYKIILPVKKHNFISLFSFWMNFISYLIAPLGCNANILCWIKVVKTNIPVLLKIEYLKKYPRFPGFSDWLCSGEELHYLAHYKGSGSLRPFLILKIMGILKYLNFLGVSLLLLLGALDVLLYSSVHNLFSSGTHMFANPWAFYVLMPPPSAYIGLQLSNTLSMDGKAAQLMPKVSQSLFDFLFLL